MDAGRLKVKSPYEHHWQVSLGVLNTFLACFCFTFNCHTLHEPSQEVRRERDYQQFNCQMQIFFFSWQKQINKGSGLKNWGETRGEKWKRMHCKRSEGWGGNRAMIPTGEIKPSTDCLSTMDPTDCSLHPPSVQWNRCNRNGWTEFSQREFKKG